MSQNTKSATDTEGLMMQIIPRISKIIAIISESKSRPKTARNRHASKRTKLAKKSVPPSPTKAPVLTSTKQSMSYFTVKGIESDISEPEVDWPVFALKELMDNAWDWLNDAYPIDTADSDTKRIDVRVQFDPTNNYVRIAVKNSNPNNITVFESLDAILDYSRWVSTKRYQHRGTSGSRGDFLKRGLGMGYASYTSNDKPEDSFEDRQWDEPLILRFNGIERKAILNVDLDTQQGNVTILDSNDCRLEDNSTEVELTLPTLLDRYELCENMSRYYKTYKIPKRNVHFSFYFDSVGDLN